jgi:hypothetical protein
MTEDSIDDAVLTFVAEFCSVDKRSVALRSRLQEDLGVIGGDAVDLMQEYARRFRVDLSSFDIGQYFDNDLTVDFIELFARTRRFLAALIGVSVSGPKPRRSLTVGELSEAAKRGKWLQHKQDLRSA